MLSRIALVIFAFLLLTVQACPDFTVDDKDGEIPEDLPASDYSASANRTTSIPSPISCAHVLTFQSDEVEAVGAAGCAGYNFATLYGRADNFATSQAGLTKCPLGPTCPNLWTWRSFHTWDCGGTPPRASASVQWKANCIGPGIAAWIAPPSIQPPTPAELQQPNPGGAGTAALSDQTMSETFFPGSVGCTPAEVVRFEYNEEVTPRPGNLQPYVQEAERLASIYHASLTCAAGCTNKPYEAIHRKWSWADNIVTVVIRFVPCR